MGYDMRIGAIIQARMGSTRLPGKVMEIISGKPMIWHVIDRLQRSEMIDEIVISSTFSGDNDVIKEFARNNGLIFFRGPEKDVLRRYIDSARNYNIDLIVRITSDCPLIDPHIVDNVIKDHMDSESDFTSNTIDRTFPRGLDVEVFSRDLLEEVDKLTTEKYHREHVTPFFYENPSKFKLVNVPANGILNRPDLRFCVDTKEDLKFIREIYSRLYRPPEIINVRDIIDLIDREPDLAMINKDVKQKRLKD